MDGKLNILNRHVYGLASPAQLIAPLDGLQIEDCVFELKNILDYRVSMVMRGPGLDARITDGDPEYNKVKSVKPLPIKAKAPAAEKTARLLNLFLAQAHTILQAQHFNQEQLARGGLPVNYLLLRKAGKLRAVASFEQRYGLKSAFITDENLISGICQYLGMREIKVAGVDATPNTNLDAELEAATKALTEYGFVFAHIKATDTFSHHGNWQSKKEFIAKVDQALARALPALTKLDPLIIITADHSTCCLQQAHCNLPIPVLAWRQGQAGDQLPKFSEQHCINGTIGTIAQEKLLPELLK